MSILTFFVILGIVYFIWLGTIKRGLNRLSCHREFSRAVVSEGEEAELIEVVRNDSPYTIPWLRVESRGSAFLRLGRQENLYVGGEQHYCSLFTLMPYQQIRRLHKVTFLRRGVYDLGSAALTSGDLLCIHRFLRTQKMSVPVTVYPRLLDPEDIPMPLSYMMGEAVCRRHLLQDPFLIRGIRPYLPGDPVRDIHWAATARTGQAQIRVKDYTNQTRLLVVLNVQHQELMWGKVLPEQDAEMMEPAISLAATLCVQALRSGSAAGFAANMPMDDGKHSAVVLPAGGSAQEDAILDTMARLKIVRTEDIIPFLEKLEGQTGLDIVLLSRYDCESLQEALEKLEQKGNRTYLHLLEGGCP